MAETAARSPDIALYPEEIMRFRAPRDEDFVAFMEAHGAAPVTAGLILHVGS